MRYQIRCPTQVYKIYTAQMPQIKIQLITKIIGLHRSNAFHGLFGSIASHDYFCPLFDVERLPKIAKNDLF